MNPAAEERVSVTAKRTRRNQGRRVTLLGSVEVSGLSARRDPPTGRQPSNLEICFPDRSTNTSRYCNSRTLIPR